MPSLFHQAFEDPTANPRDVYLARLAILAITVTILGSLMLIALLASM